MNFGGAVEALKNDKRVLREGWNGKNMWIVLVKETNYSVDATRSGSYCVSPFIGMKTADDKFVPWLASQTDVLAEDWMVL